MKTAATMIFLGLCVFLSFSTQASGGVSARNLRWREVKWDLRLELQPVDDTIHLSARGYLPSPRQDLLQIYFPTIYRDRSVFLLDRVRRSGTFDWKDWGGAIEPVRTRINGIPSDGTFTVIGTLTPRMKEEVLNSSRLGLFSSWQLQVPPTSKGTKAAQEIEADIFLTSGCFHTQRHDKYFPFDRKQLWFGLGEHESTDAFISLVNLSDFRMSDVNLFYSRKYESPEILTRIPTLQRTPDSVTARTNIEPDEIIVFQAVIQRSPTWARFWTVIFALLTIPQPFLIVSGLSKKTLPIILVSLLTGLFANVILFLSLIPNHPHLLTIFDLALVFGFFAGTLPVAKTHLPWKASLTAIGIIVCCVFSYWAWAQ